MTVAAPGALRRIKPELRRRRGGRPLRCRMSVRASGCIIVVAACLVIGLAGLAAVDPSSPNAATPTPATQKPGPTIRVLLMQGVREFGVTVDGPFAVGDGAGRVLATRERGLELTTAAVHSGGKDGPSLDVNGLRATSPVVELAPRHSGTLGLVFSGEGDDNHVRYYWGLLRCILHADGTADLVNVVDVEAYLKGVLPGELPASFHIETFKAQAVAARTYALYEKMTVGRKRDWDVTGTQNSQVYVGLDGEKDCPKAIAAVDATRGVVCVWNSPSGPSIFCTFYCAVCGGRTRDTAHMSNGEQISPLAGGVECKHCWKAPKGFFRWGPEVISKKAITERLRHRYERFRELGAVEKVEVAETDGLGRPIIIRVVDGNGRHEDLRAENFRLAVDPTGLTLKSADFRIVDRPGKVIFTHGKGWGHGCGLCQWGAEGLARSGLRAGQILATYYPTSFLKRGYE